MLFSAIYMIGEIWERNVNCVSSKYIENLMQEVAELCAKCRAGRIHPLSRQEWRGQIRRHRLSRSIGAASESQRWYPVTLSLLHFVKSPLVLQWILFSYNESSAGRQWGHDFPFRITPAECHQLTICSILMASAPKSTKTYLLLPPNNNTERTQYMQSIFLINNYCLEYVSLLFCCHQYNVVSVSNSTWESCAYFCTKFRSIYLSKPMIKYSWMVVYYTMLLPDNLLDTTMTALRVPVISMIIIHELMTWVTKTQ